MRRRAGSELNRKTEQPFESSKTKSVSSELVCLVLSFRASFFLPTTKVQGTRSLNVDWFGRDWLLLPSGMVRRAGGLIVVWHGNV